MSLLEPFLCSLESFKSFLAIFEPFCEISEPFSPLMILFYVMVFLGYKTFFLSFWAILWDILGLFWSSQNLLRVLFGTFRPKFSQKIFSRLIHFWNFSPSHLAPFHLLIKTKNSYLSLKHIDTKKGCKYHIISRTTYVLFTNFFRVVHRFCHTLFQNECLEDSSFSGELCLEGIFQLKDPANILLFRLNQAQGALTQKRLTMFL